MDTIQVPRAGGAGARSGRSGEQSWRNVARLIDMRRSRQKVWRACRAPERKITQLWRAGSKLAAMKKLIAIVEDERAIRDNYAAAFAREGYSVQGYANRRAALAAF